jgi:S-adenosylmethionine:tRNA ribosyltransferase-isomerase
MISIKDFDYPLPEERIAQYPLPERDKSKLLIYKQGTISEDIFERIPEYLPDDSALFYNDTRVINARLLFKKPSGAQIEILCLEPFDPADYNLAFQKTGETMWLCMVGNLKKWKGEILSLSLSTPSGSITVGARLVENCGHHQKVKFFWEPSELAFGSILEAAGYIPLPPYIKREAENIDKIRYQTVFSRLHGSVAAPTAGLHFSEKVLDQIRQKNIHDIAITLHVGAGTFRPVKNENVLEHHMHGEHFYIKQETLKQIRQYLGNITAVGTTTLRALESVYWLGTKLMQNPQITNMHVAQWEYQHMPQPSVEEVLDFLIHLCEKQRLEGIHAETQLMIIPGYTFRIVNRLITNFHQPQSTLLLLVAAFVGTDRWRHIYDYALNHDFRFLSYGDSSLLMP